MNKAKICLYACLCILAALPAPAKGDTIQVTSDSVFKRTLSDLIVYGDPNDPKQKKVILAPNDPNDDIKFTPGMSRMFDVDFKITKYTVSMTEKILDGGYSEVKSQRVFVVERVIPKKLACIDIGPYLQEQLRTILEIDQSVAPEPPPVGTILAFVNGRNPQIPGWFVGTDINFDTGEVTGAYTGNVEVFSIPFEVLVFTPPYPPDGAVDIPLYADLHWPKSKEAESYDVYFGTDFDDVKYGRFGTFKGSTSGTTYDPGTLEPCTTYYWRIEPVIEEEEEEEEPPIIVGSPITTGEVRIYADVSIPYEPWSFTTSGRKAANPYPVNGATDVDPNAILSWTRGCECLYDDLGYAICIHDVYFGTDFYAVANANPGSPEYKGQLTFDANDYNPGGLEPGTTYYWRIDEVVSTLEEVPIVCKGDIWYFTTADYRPSIVDDFESYPVGTFPSAGGWEIVWAGTGENYVTDTHSFSKTKSLQLWGRPNWASVAQKKFSTDAPVIGYEFAIRIDSIGTGGPGRVEHPGFFSREAYIWGAYYARVIFNHDTGKIEAEDGSILGDWEPGVWYQVKVVLDRRTNTYSTWIDHQFKGDGWTTSRTDTHLIDALALISAHPGVKVYYDDVSVF